MIQSSLGLTPNWGSTLTRVPAGGTDTGYAYAYVLLDNPVIQGDFETIDIFYRVYFLNGRGVGMSAGNDVIRNIGRRFFSVTSTNPWGSNNCQPTSFFQKI